MHMHLDFGYMNMRCCGVKAGQSFAFGVWRLLLTLLTAFLKYISTLGIFSATPSVQKGKHSLHEPEPPFQCASEQLHLASQLTVGRPREVNCA
jgi:hypothetical protein